MKKIHTKEAAEAILRELPSVRGAFVREDVYGHPREVHVLVGPGPEPRLLARDIRELLEERLGVPVDQRVISIAQLTDRGDQDPSREFASPPGNGTTTAAAPAMPAYAATHAGTGGAPAATGAVRTAAPGPEARRAPRRRPAPGAGNGASRLVFDGMESTVSGGRVVITVRVTWKGKVFEGRAEDLDGGSGRIRAVAAATLRAASEACAGNMHLELESASVVQAIGRSYVLVSVLAVSPLLGRKPVPLAGAHPCDEGDEAAALAALQATNRVLTLALRD